MSTDGQPKVSDFGISAFMDNTIAQVWGPCAGRKGWREQLSMRGKLEGSLLGAAMGRNADRAAGPATVSHTLFRWQLHGPLQCHTFLGTVTYMSPERINGQPYSFPADIWALVGGVPDWGGLGSSWQHNQRPSGNVHGLAGNPIVSLRRCTSLLGCRG